MLLLTVTNRINRRSGLLFAALWLHEQTHLLSSLSYLGGIVPAIADPYVPFLKGQLDSIEFFSQL